MINLFAYIVIFILFIVIVFFLGRSLVILFTILTEVPYLPSNKAYKEAVKYLDIKAGDKVLDMGCGDGRVLRYTSKMHPEADFIGIDRNIFLVIYAEILKVLQRRENLHFKHVNIHNFDLSSFDKIYVYLLPGMLDKIFLKRKKELKKGCIVVSFHYNLGKKFCNINNVVKYPVKYGNKQEYIFKWVNE